MSCPFLLINVSNKTDAQTIPWNFEPQLFQVATQVTRQRPFLAMRKAISLVQAT